MSIAHMEPNTDPEGVAKMPTGIERLDAMLAGGVHRGTSTLIGGSPGRAKSTLPGAGRAAFGPSCRRQGRPGRGGSAPTGTERLTVDQQPEREQGAGPLSRPVETLRLRLYIAGQAPTSVRALANLDAVCRKYGLGRVELEVVDVLLEPLRALDDRILSTPTLVKLAPSPLVRIAGDLSQQVEVLYALGLASLAGGTEPPPSGPG